MMVFSLWFFLYLHLLLLQFQIPSKYEADVIGHTHLAKQQVPRGVQRCVLFDILISFDIFIDFLSFLDLFYNFLSFFYIF